MNIRRILIACMTMWIAGFACTAGSAPRPTGSTTQPGAIDTTGPASTPAGAQFQSTPTVTPPAPNAAFPLATARLQAIQVSDDDGGRQAEVTPQQVKQWVDKANEIYAEAGVRFIYDPGSDFATLKSTLINGIAGDTDAQWKREVGQGNKVAADYPGKVAIFFRYGPDKGPTGGGFSSVDYNFVAVPGFNATGVCGHQNIGLLAHEVGHYFGLSHPFAQTFASLQEAESFLTAHKNDPQSFDGDGLSDTPPDPFIDTPKFQCNPKPAIALNGLSFPLPFKNIMSYYYTNDIDRTELTPQQTQLVRWILGLRTQNKMATPVNTGVPGAIEFADLTVRDKAGVDPSVQDMSGFGDAPRWSGDRQLFCGAGPDGSIGFNISVAAAGKYTLDLYATLAPDFGKIQTLVDGNPLGSPVDLYGLLVLPTGRVPIGAIDLSAGTHTLGFRVAGRNPASKGTSFGLSSFTLTAGQ